MPAVNGIYILMSLRRPEDPESHRHKQEYRVAYAEDIDLTTKPDYPTDNPNYNRSKLLETFSQSRVFHDKKLAEGYAIRLLDEHEGQGSVKHRIVWLKDCREIRFPNRMDFLLGRTYVPIPSEREMAEDPTFRR